MNQIAQIYGNDLPSLVDRAASALTGARTAAEVLQARDMADFAYDAAKRVARLARAKDAHDELISAAYRAQADALEIESQAKRRLADEYDAAQERGEVRSNGERGKAVPDENGFSPATTADLGLTRKQIHEARIVRDAEEKDPGVVRRTLDERIESGQEPNKAALREAVVAAAERGLKPAPRPSNKNPNYKPDPQANAMLAVAAGCANMMEKVRDLDPAWIAQGFVSDTQKERSLQEIRECRDFLTRFLEIANAEQ